MFREMRTEKSRSSLSEGWICALLVGMFCMYGSRVSAQNLEAGLFGGAIYYIGDLNPGTPFLNPGLAYGVLARYDIDDRWAVKVSVSHGKVQGNSTQSKYMPERNLAFGDQITDFSAVAEFNFFNFYIGSHKNWINPYIYAGFSFFLFNPKNGVVLRDLGTEGQNIGYEGRKPYNTYSFGIPFGLGVKISLTGRLALAVFWEMHKTFTDYIDDVSTTYYLDGHSIDPNVPYQVLSDPTRSYSPGMQRGNSRTNDWYSFSGVTLSYKFNLLTRKRCKDLEH